MRSIDGLLERLPPLAVEILRQAPPELLEKMTEIRLRSNLPLAITAGARTVFLSRQGREVTAANGVIIRQSTVQQALLSLCGHSLHGIEKTLEQGYFTAAGGFRVGVCMQPFAARQGLAQSLCIRLPREVQGAAEPVYRVWRQGGGIILAGPPASGKTTVLRDLCRMISDGDQGEAPCRTVLIDERNEISGWNGCECAFRLGSCTDILSGLPKAAAVTQAIRTLAPQVILCDEVADTAEAAAIRYAFFCGVRFAVTVHCGSEEEVFQNAVISELMQSGAFDCIYLLGLPVGKSKGKAVTKNEYDIQAAGCRADNGRLRRSGLCTGGTAAQPQADGGNAGAVLGGLYAPDGADRAAADRNRPDTGGTRPIP